MSKQYVITIRIDLKSTLVYGPFGSEKAAYDFLEHEVENIFSDTDLVDVREIAAPEVILDDFAEEEFPYDENVVEGDNESNENSDVDDAAENDFSRKASVTYVEPVLTDDEKKYHTANYYYSVYMSSYQLQKVYAVMAKGDDPDEYINELFWSDPEAAIQEMVDSDFSMVRSREEVVVE